MFSEKQSNKGFIELQRITNKQCWRICNQESSRNSEKTGTEWPKFGVYLEYVDYVNR
jgi:hypothetical protein